jgi:hypothetical protein
MWDLTRYEPDSGSEQRAGAQCGRPGVERATAPRSCCLPVPASDPTPAHAHSKSAARAQQQIFLSACLPSHFKLSHTRTATP